LFIASFYWSHDGNQFQSPGSDYRTEGHNSDRKYHLKPIVEISELPILKDLEIDFFPVLLLTLSSSAKEPHNRSVISRPAGVRAAQIQGITSAPPRMHLLPASRKSSHLEICAPLPGPRTAPSQR
jgi:hypothetical protein